MENQIKVVTLPVIEYSTLDVISDQVKQEIEKANFQSLAPTEDTLAFLKTTRAKLNSQFKEFEEARKAIKEAVNEPYNLFNLAYEEKIAKQYKDAERFLKTNVELVENKLKDERIEKLKEYFNSLITPEIDFIKFENVDLKITLSDSMKSFKDKITAFVTKTLDDYNLIMVQPESARILVRYKSNLNVSQAITSVAYEIKQEQALEQAKTVVIEHTTEVKSYVEEKVVEAEPVEAIEPEVVKDVDPILTANFTVTGRRSALIELKKYILDLGLTLK